LAVMINPFASQVLSIKANKISNATAGLLCGCCGIGNRLHFLCNAALCYYGNCPNFFAGNHLLTVLVKT